MNQLVSRLWSNKHTSSAAIAYVGVIAISKLGEIWLPSHKDQFEATAEAIKGIAVGYGFLMAGDSGSQQQTNTDSGTPHN